MKRLAAVIAAAVFMSGCVPHTELDRLGIAEAVGVDYADGKYTVTVQYFNTDSSGGVTAVDSSAPNAVTVRGEGGTIENALQEVSYTSGCEIMLGAASVIVFGEDALFSLRDSLSLAASHYSGNLRALTAAARGKAEDVMNVRFTEGNASVEKLTDMLVNAEKLGLTRPIELYEALEKLCGSTSSVVLPLLEVYTPGTDSTEDGTSIRIAGGAVCSDGSFIGELYTSEMSGLCILDPRPGRGGSCELTLSYHGDDTRVMLYGIAPRITPGFADGRLRLDIDVSCCCKIVSTAVPDPYRERNGIGLLCEEELRSRIAGLLKKTAAKGADAVGLEYAIRGYSPPLWRSIGSRASDHLADADISVVTSVQMERYGVLRPGE